MASVTANAALFVLQLSLALSARHKIGEQANAQRLLNFYHTPTFGRHVANVVDQTKKAVHSSFTNVVGQTKEAMQPMFGRKGATGDDSWKATMQPQADVQRILNFNIAPAFGDGSMKMMEHVETMDLELKKILADAEKRIQETNDNSWGFVDGMFRQASSLKPMDIGYAKSDKYIFKSEKVLFKGVDTSIPKLVPTWFNALVNDSDVAEAAGLDIGAAGVVVAGQLCADWTWAGEQKHSEEKHLAIGVLRYPDLEDPRVKVYRIELRVWSDCSRGPIKQTNNNGAALDVNIRGYNLKDTIKSTLVQELLPIAIRDAESLFD